MKKLLTVILILAMILPAAALADVDLSGMTFDELVALREQLNMAIWNSQEWQAVTVPIGVWKIGEDIPAREWTISVAEDATRSWGDLFYCSKLDETGLKADWSSDAFTYLQLSGPTDDENANPKSVDIDCKEGMYIVIDGTPMVFQTYTGKPDLGFK